MTNNSQILSPFTMRMNAIEREKLAELAQSLDVSQAAFIRAKIFDGLPVGNAKSNLVADHESLSKLLLLLGESRIANNLNQLAKHANQGTLNLTSAEIESQLEESYLAIQWMRKTLINTLGLRS
jgi:hypothetical protein